MYNADIVIVNYNSGPHLADAVVSLAEQPVGRIIVVDNGSSDGSLSAVPNLDRLMVIENNANLGFAAACNIGISHSTADALLFLNPDARLEKDALERLLEVLYSAPDIGMVGGLLLYPDGREQRGGRRRMPTPVSAFVLAFSVPLLRRFWPDKFATINLNEEPLPEGPIDIEAISGACMLVKRSALARVGEWDEGYFLHCEDLDWCKRFAFAGLRVVFVPDARITHTKGASSGRRLFVEWHKHLGMRRFFRKYYASGQPIYVSWFIELGIWLHFVVIALLSQLARLRSLALRKQKNETNA